MQIIIPMSGFGERFRRAGYQVPKPLIEVDGKPIIAHVIDMFPGETQLIFVCNQDHLDVPEYRMAAILNHYCPTGKIVGIQPHKQGPVHAVQQVFGLMDDDEPTIINYCDFTCYWDYTHFKQFVRESACEGAIPCYTGFHPHMLGSTSYAYVRTEGTLWGLDIQEKQPFTDTPNQEYASSGTYYYASGFLAKHYINQTIAQKLTVGGEYYASLVYKPMFADGRSVAVYPLQHFMQWGTPADLREYLWWSAAFRRLVAPDALKARHPGTILIPMAGLGSRFVREEYSLTKPLIPVSGRPMVCQATGDMPQAERYVFVVRSDMPQVDAVISVLEQTFPDPCILYLDQVTDGQARTCLAGMSQVDYEKPLTITACDNGALYDPDALQTLLDDPETDVIVWGARHYPGAARFPTMYGWIATEGNQVTLVSVKTPLEDPNNDPIIIGAFTFKSAKQFVAAAERMIGRNARVNGEFYVDMCINDALALGLRCRLFEIDYYLCWGTPNDLRTFEYWQSCFHKWPNHAYQLEKDSRLDARAANELAHRYQIINPTIPEPRS